MEGGKRLEMGETHNFSGLRSLLDLLELRRQLTLRSSVCKAFTSLLIYPIAAVMRLGSQMQIGLLRLA